MTTPPRHSLAELLMQTVGMVAVVGPRPSVPSVTHRFIDADPAEPRLRKPCYRTRMPEPVRLSLVLQAAPLATSSDGGLHAIDMWRALDAAQPRCINIKTFRKALRNLVASGVVLTSGRSTMRRYWRRAT